MRARIRDALDARWRLVPFRARLTLGFAGAMVILFGGLALLLHTLVESGLDEQINRSLSTRAVDLSTLVASRSDLPALPDSGGTFAQLIDPVSGAVIDATEGHSAPLLNRDQLAWAVHHTGIVDDGHNARLRVQPAATKPRSVLVVGASLEQRNHTLTILSEMLFAGGPLLLVLTCCAGYVLAARSLAPVETMSARAARISGAPAGERLPVPEAHDEIRALGETLNSLLDRVDAALARERSFVADASHELRTPLAVLKLELEFALASDISREELQERVGSAAEEVDRLTKVAQDLLLIARADQGRLPLERREVDVDALLATVVERFAQPARLHDRAVHVQTGAVGVIVDADATWLEQAVGNLVSNALRYGAGPVTLTVAVRGDRVELHVLDEGCGFDPRFIAVAFERFARSDLARAGVGNGLGLPIVRAIAEAHGGSAGVRNRAEGGADAWVALPIVRTLAKAGV